MFNSGQHVEAQWTNGGYFGARVVQSNGSHYEVAWDDGSPNLWVEAHQVRPSAQGGAGGAFAVGSHVKAQWTNGQLFGARIVQFNGLQYEVAWDDGSPNLWLGENQLEPEGQGGSGAFSVGSHVTAEWTNGQMYGARIAQFNGLQYEVMWDDGSPNLWLQAHQIQAEGFAPGQPVMARWTNGGDYPGTIVRAEGASCEVAWADGSPNLWVELPHIRAR